MIISGVCRFFCYFFFFRRKVFLVWFDLSFFLIYLFFLVENFPINSIQYKIIKFQIFKKYWTRKLMKLVIMKIKFIWNSNDKGIFKWLMVFLATRWLHCDDDFLIRILFFFFFLIKMFGNFEFFFVLKIQI